MTHWTTDTYPYREGELRTCKRLNEIVRGPWEFIGVDEKDYPVLGVRRSSIQTPVGYAIGKGGTTVDEGERRLHLIRMFDGPMGLWEAILFGREADVLHRAGKNPLGYAQGGSREDVLRAAHADLMTKLHYLIHATLL